jgi:prephenate dehydrogenase
VASGSPDMWRDIVLTNREQVLSEIDAYIETLKSMKETLKTESPENIHSLFSNARKLRNQWLDSR